MSAYTVLRLLHGYWRWVVLVAAIVVLVRVIRGAFATREWTGGDERAVRRFLSALDFQVGMGFVLYFVFSPFFTAAYQSFRETMSGQVSRFFAIEHGTAMFLAAAAAHVGHVRAKQAVDGARKHRTMLIALIVFGALALWAIPWPWRPFGRPLFRTTF